MGYYRSCNFSQGNVLINVLQPVNKFNLVFCYSAANIDAIGDTDEIGIFELYAGAFIAVVEEDIDAGGFEICSYSFSCGEESGIVDVGNGDDDLKGCDGRVKRVGVAIVCCSGGLDGGGEDALDADAVAAHDGGDLFAVAVEDRGSHGLRVFASKLEDVADLDGFAET